MRLLFLSLCCCAALACSLTLDAQTKHVPLSEEDTDKLRDSADKPPERVKLYIKFTDERIASVKSILATKRSLTPVQTLQLHNLMDEFTHLVDELQDNLDEYDERHSDIRKPLKEILDADARWQDVLKSFPPDPSYDFAHKTAQEAATSIAEAAQKMMDEQTLYFKDKKKSPK